MKLDDLIKEGAVMTPTPKPPLPSLHDAVYDALNKESESQRSLDIYDYTSKACEVLGISHRTEIGEEIKAGISSMLRRQPIHAISTMIEDIYNQHQAAEAKKALGSKKP